MSDPATIHAACALCAGACCESIVMPVAIAGPAAVWLRYHGNPVGALGVELPCACRMLVDGKCSVYDHRPDNCRADVVGGQMCRDAVKRRRENWRKIVALM